MVKLYIMKIHRGEMTINDVPVMWIRKVAFELEKEKKGGNN